MTAVSLHTHLMMIGARLEKLARPWDLKAAAAAGYPGLRRAMLVTTYRPWSWRDPLDSWLAWRIRRYQDAALNLPEGSATENHAMLYVGGGRCASQGPEMGIIHLKDYRRCRVAFWDWPDWLKVTQAQRDKLVAESAVHAGEEYAYSDIAAIWMWAVTGCESWLEQWGDPTRFICSERICDLARRHLWPGFAGESTCLRAVPHWLAGWMYQVGFKPTVYRLE